MYLPSHFAMKDVQQMHALMMRHPFAALVTTSSDGLCANHIPFLLQTQRGEQGVLQGHVARANPLWREVNTSQSGFQNVLVIFQGPQSYISPSWYPTKQEHGKVVPTWNYSVVHAQGQLRVVDDAAWLRSLVNRLTVQHETGLERPWSVDDAPSDYIDKMVSAIVGIEITITHLEGKVKLSQNQPAMNREGVVQALSARADDASCAMAVAINTSVPR
jgi:transcriptional regulator